MSPNSAQATNSDHDLVHAPVWVWVFALTALSVAVLLLQGNTSLLSAEVGTWLHEVTHDGRHALGVPCD